MQEHWGIPLYSTYRGDTLMFYPHITTSEYRF